MQPRLTLPLDTLTPKLPPDTPQISSFIAWQALVASRTPWSHPWASWMDVYVQLACFYFFIHYVVVFTRAVEWYDSDLLSKAVASAECCCSDLKVSGSTLNLHSQHVEVSLCETLNLSLLAGHRKAWASALLIRVAGLDKEGWCSVVTPTAQPKVHEKS